MLTTEGIGGKYAARPDRVLENKKLAVQGRRIAYNSKFAIYEGSAAEGGCAARERACN